MLSSVSSGTLPAQEHGMAQSDRGIGPFPQMPEGMVSSGAGTVDRNAGKASQAADSRSRLG